MPEPSQDAITNRVHWWYEYRKDVRIVAQNFFLGGEFVTKEESYLWQHQAEDTAAYALRRKMSKYENRIGRILQVKTDSIFRAKILRATKPGSPEEAFLKNVDGRGTSVDDYMRNWFQAAEKEDVAYTLIDRPAAPVPVNPAEPIPIQTAAQAEAFKLFPRWIFIRAPDLMDWVTGAEGEILAIKFRQLVPNIAPLDVPAVPAKSVYEYFIWTTTGRVHYNKDGKEISRQPLNLRAVPLVPLYSKYLEPMISVSRNDDAVGLAQLLYNNESQLGSEIHFHGYTTEVLPSRMRPTGGTEVKQEAIRGAGHYCGVDPDSKWQPFLLETNGKPVEILSTRSEELIDKMCDAMAVRRVNQQSAAGEGASGEAKKWDFMATNDDTAGSATRCEAAENRAHYFVALWNADGNVVRAEETAFKAQYPSDFNLKTGDEMLAEIEHESLVITASPTYLLARQREYINSHPSKKSFTPEENEAIDLELEAQERSADVSPPPRAEVKEEAEAESSEVA